MRGYNLTANYITKYIYSSLVCQESIKYQQIIRRAYNEILHKTKGKGLGDN